MLHMEAAHARRTHYVGIARDYRLATRLREHASGNGALRPRVVALLGGRLWHVRSVPVYSMKAEANYIALWVHGRGCPICSGLRPHSDFVEITIPEMHRGPGAARPTLDY